MAFKDRYDFENLVNESERLVIEELERQLALPENSEACQCEECILDMAAFALNSVRPVYRVSLLGTLYAGAMDQTAYVLELQAAVQKAVSRIRANPAH